MAAQSSEEQKQMVGQDSDGDVAEDGVDARQSG